MINNSIISFFCISLVMALMPGPDNIFLISQSTIQGKRAGLFLSSGLCAGLIFHTLAVAMGVAAALETYPMALVVIKILGGSYLIYLAWMSFKNSGAIIDNSNNVDRKGLFLRGVLMNITNPKVSIFFLAFLPQFVVPGNGPVAEQLVFLGLLFMLAAGIVFSIISLMAGTMGKKFLNSTIAVTRMNRVGGCVFIVLAVKIFL